MAYDKHDRFFPDKSVILVGIAVAFSLFGDMTVYTVIPVYYQTLGLSPIQVGILLSANRWIRLITNNLAERICRKHNPLLLLCGALVIGSLMASLYAVTPPFPLFLLGRAVWGLCWSFLRQIGVMNSINRASEDRMGRVLGFYNAMVRLGFIAGTFCGGLLFDAVGYRLAFFSAAVLSLAGLPVGALALRRAGPVTAPARIDPESSRGRSLGIVVRGFVVGCVGSGIIMSTLGFILNYRLGNSFILAGVVIGIASINGFFLAARPTIISLVSPFLGALLDRVGRKKGQLFLFPGAAAALLCILITAEPVVLLLMMMIFFICDAALGIALSVEAGRFGPKRYALLATSMDAGAAFGPLISWIVIQAFPQSLASLLLGGLLYLIAAAAVVLDLRRPAAGGTGG